MDISNDRVYAQRYWVLTIFTGLTLSQAMTWFTFSAIPEETKSFYKITSHDIDLLAMWGPIAFCTTVPFFAWLLSHTLRGAIVLAAAIEVAATVLRAHFALGPESVMYLHIGAILNATVGTVTMCAPPQIRCAWALIWLGKQVYVM